MSDSSNHVWYEYVTHVYRDGSSKIVAMNLVDNEPAAAPTTNDEAVEVIQTVMPGSEVISEEEDKIVTLIRKAESQQQLEAIWSLHRNEWTDTHSTEASKRKKEIG